MTGAFLSWKRFVNSVAALFGQLLQQDGLWTLKIWTRLLQEKKIEQRRSIQESEPNMRIFSKTDTLISVYSKSYFKMFVLGALSL